MITANKSRRIELTEGFFKNLPYADNEDIQPILQIMNSRLTNDGSSIRLRLNDGQHSYATILLREKGFEKFKAYEMDNTHQSIIKLLDYSANDVIKDSVRRIFIRIKDFDLILKDSPFIGTPIPYSGNPNDYHEIKVEDILQSSITKEENNESNNQEDNHDNNHSNNNQDNNTANKIRKIELTEGFFKNLPHPNTDDADDTERLQPVLQIMNSRLTKDDSSIRLRLNDGQHSYASILLRDKGFEKFKAYEMDNTHQSIIKVLDYSARDVTKDSVRRIFIRIKDFDLIEKDSPLIGRPIPYSGNPTDYHEIKVENKVNNKENKEENKKDLPIIRISPYLMQWKIRGVVIEKSILRDVNTSKGPTKVFNFCIIDKEGTSIKISAFGDLATKFFNTIQESESYIIKGNNKAIKSANTRFNTTGHEYEIIIRNDMEIDKCDPPSQMPVQKIKRVSLNQIKLNSDKLIDIIAIVHNIEEPIDINTKRGMTKRRMVYLLDQSKTLVPLTIWGNYCNDFTADMLHQPIILKNVTVTEFNGNYGLNYNFNSKIIPSDGSEVIQNLANWYANERDTMEIVSNLHI